MRNFILFSLYYTLFRVILLVFLYYLAFLFFCGKTLPNLEVFYSGDYSTRRFTLHKMGKIVSFSNQKGGVGKTTSCVNISAQIANKGKKVLMIDMDPQGNATSGLGLSKSKIKKTI